MNHINYIKKTKISKIPDNPKSKSTVLKKGWRNGIIKRKENPTK